MRKKLTAITLAVLAFSMIAASAASMGPVTTSKLGATSDVVSSCDIDGVQVDFAVAFGSGEYRTSAVNVSGIAAGCLNQAISVTLMDASNTDIGSASGTVLGGTYSASISASAEDVEGVAIVIEG